jgi:hypothetical protein
VVELVLPPLPLLVLLWFSRTAVPGTRSYPSVLAPTALNGSASAAKAANP